MKRRYTDEEAIEKINTLKAMLPLAEAERPSRDFTKIRALLDLIERAILTKNYDVEQAALLEYEEEWYHVTGMSGRTSQKHRDC